MRNETSMRRDFGALAGPTFDLIVVGGGIIGAGIARDAALRGLNTLLLEKEDFAYGTTSRSSRLIHGGLRYLKRLEFRLVRQDLREREVLLAMAPHLVHPFPFVIPVTRGSRPQRIALALGMRLYDLLSFDKSLPSHRRLSRSETLELEPGLELKGLTGSYLYYDCQVPFMERLCLENVISAAEHGATVVNHARVTGLLRAGSAVSGVRVQDLLSEEVCQARARMVVNAAGPWVDHVWEMLDITRKPAVRRTKGVHLLTGQVSKNAVAFFAQSDGRLVFVIPWQGYSLIGTTDTDYSGDLDDVHAEAEDVAYLLAEVQRLFPSVTLEAVFHTCAGLRPLVYSKAGKPSDVSRAHVLVDHERGDGVGGFVSVLGGKITAYRAIAEEAVSLVCRKLGHKRSCSTSEAPLPGAPVVSRGAVEQAARESDLPVETVSHLASLYGSRLGRLVDLARRDASGGQLLCPHCRDVMAQVWYAVEEESALTVSDFLLRRTAVGLGPCQGLDAVERVSQEMGRLLHWSASEQRQQVEAYRVRAAMGQRFRTGAPVVRGGAGHHTQ